MLPSQYQLKRKKDFDILFKEGFFVGGQSVTLKVWKIVPEVYPKRAFEKDALLIGFVVGLKISKNAVKRNRAKRQMREVVRLLLQNQQLRTGYLIACIAKKEVLTAPYSDIETDIVTLLKKAKVLV